MKFMVYERRMLIEALKTKALLVATLNPDRAEKAAQDYMEMAIPVGEGALDERLKRRERELEEIANMKPITLGQIKAGQSLQGTQDWSATTSMHRR
jgi:hypothetical protein